MIDPSKVAAVLSMYDGISNFAGKHGLNLDAGMKSLISSFLNHPGALNKKDLSSAWDAASVEDALRNTPFDDGDIEAVYEEDINGDGDTDVTKMDTTGDGKTDTVAVTADTKKEEKDADKLAQDLAGEELTSTGKTDDELDSGEDAGFVPEETTIPEEDEKPKSNWREMIEMLLPGLPGFHGNL